MNPIVLESELLRVTVSPDVGGTINSVEHKRTGLSVLGNVPWQAEATAIPGFAARDETEWLTRYTGGWPVLFPNAGDACTVEDTFLGFHGEASIAPWDAVIVDGALILTRAFSSVPATMRRTIRVQSETLAIREDLTYHGQRPAVVMWGHHPTFGSDLLSGPFEVTCGARDVQAEAHYDPPCSPVAPGARGTWPTLPSKSGCSIDLAHPRSSWSSVAYLTTFAAPWAAIRRMDNAIAALLTWDAERFPCAWLWYELAGNQAAPWGGNTWLVGIEPNTTPCALGLREAVARNAPVLRLESGTSHSATVALHVFQPSGPILNGIHDIPADSRPEQVRRS